MGSRKRRAIGEGITELSNNDICIRADVGMSLGNSARCVCMVLSNSEASGIRRDILLGGGKPQLSLLGEFCQGEQ